MIAALRMGVVAVAVGAAAVACGGGDRDARPSGPVGSVLDIQGQVRASRPGAASRALAVRDAVFADDTIATGEVGAVSIRLDHNGAVWRLGPNTERVVSESAAWRADKTAGTLASSIDDGDSDRIRTAAAGRHAERAAASPGTRAAEREAAKDDALEDTKGAIGAGESGTGLGYGSGSGSGAGQPGAPARPRPTVDAVRVTGPLAKDIVRRIFRRSVIKLSRCAERAVTDKMYQGKLRIRFAVTAASTVSEVQVEANPPSDTVVTCVRTAVKALQIPHEAGKSDVEIDVTLSMP